MTRTTRQDWLNAAIEALKADGPEGMTIERLCAAVGKTKGSFYHHFGNAAGLRDALLADWEERQTSTIIEETEAEPDFSKRPEVLSALVASADWGAERALRAWAWRSPEVRAHVQAVDRRRVAYLTHFYPDATPERAAELAFIEYAAFVGALHLFEESSPERSAKLSALLGHALQAASHHSRT